MDVINFLDKSYTAYHAVKHSEYILEKHGFSELNLADKWNLEVGGKYYVVKNGTSVIAFVVGENFAFNIAASHTDSPCLHVKGRDLLSSPEGARLNVEAYGGLILYSMLDAPLKVAGRIIENTAICSRAKSSRATTTSLFHRLRYTTIPTSTRRFR